MAVDVIDEIDDDRDHTIIANSHSVRHLRPPSNPQYPTSHPRDATSLHALHLRRRLGAALLRRCMSAVFPRLPAADIPHLIRTPQRRRRTSPSRPRHLRRTKLLHTSPAPRTVRIHPAPRANQPATARTTAARAPGYLLAAPSHLRTLFPPPTRTVAARAARRRAARPSRCGCRRHGPRRPCASSGGRRATFSSDGGRL